MTKNLRRKLLRDIRQNIVQFLAIFVMCFLAMYVMESFDSDREGMSRSLDEYYTETNFVDMYLTSEGFSYQDLETVKNTAGVKDAELRATYTGKARISGSEKKIEFNFIDSNNISKMLLYDGKPFSTGEGGIWIDRDFAKRQNITVGDILSLTLDGISFSEPVKGIILNPDHMYFMIDETYTDPDIGAYGYAFLDTSEYPGQRITFDRIYVDARDVTNQFNMDEADEKALEKLEGSLRAVLNVRGLEFVAKQNEAGFDSMALDLESDETLGTVFPVLFTIIALLGIMTTMTRLVVKQRTTIGTLKAIGFSQSAIMVHYISYSVVIALLGCILGAVSGWWTLGKYLHVEMNKYYSAPYSRMQVSVNVVLAILFICLMAGLTNYFSCRKLLILHASEILRPEAPTVTDAGFLEHTPLWKRLGFEARWNLRDINRNKIRTFAAFLGITLCASLLLTAFGINELQGGIEHWEYYELSPAGYNIGFAEGTDYETVYDYARQYNGQMALNVQTELYGANNHKILNVTVLDEGNLYLFQNESGDYFDLPSDGIAISAKAADELDLRLGSFVRFKMPGSSVIYEDRISAVFKTPSAQGIAMKREVFERLGARFTPNTVYTNVSVPASYVEDRAEIVSVFSKEEFIESLHAHSEAMNTEVAYIMVVAIVIGIVVLYNLGVLSFVEKTREIATLKVLGFSTNRIRWILQQQNIAITGMGTVIGIFIGYRILGFLMFQIDADTDFIIKLSIWPFLAAFFISFVLSLAVNALISSMVKDINMVEALKGVE